MPVKALPLILAGTHAAFAAIVFGAAIASPERNGLAPIILFFVDFPVSVGFEWMRRLLHGDLGYTMRLLVDCSIYMVFGSGWFYALGVVLGQAIRAMR